MTKAKFAIVTISVALLCCWFSRATVLSAAAAWLDVGTPPAESDYVFVLNGDVNVRPFIGAAIVNAGYSSRVLLVPMQQPPKQAADPTPPNHEIDRRVLIHQGVAADKITVFEGNVVSTFDEAQALLKYLTECGEDDATVSIVTSNFHTRRTRWTYRRVFGSDAARLRFVSAPTEGYGATDWWRVEEGFVVYGTEFLKLGFYVFRYGNGLLISGTVAAVTLAGVVGLRLKRTAASREPAVDV